jgi:hypothetical protein
MQKWMQTWMWQSVQNRFVSDVFGERGYQRNCVCGDESGYYDARNLCSL